MCMHGMVIRKMLDLIYIAGLTWFDRLDVYFHKGKSSISGYIFTILNCVLQDPKTRYVYVHTMFGL